MSDAMDNATPNPMKMEAMRARSSEEVKNSLRKLKAYECLEEMFVVMLTDK